MDDDTESYFETEIPLTPEQDAAYAGPGKWLLVAGVVFAIAVALFAIIRQRSPIVVALRPAT